ncbi:MAG: hypothetical protein HZB51_11990 [Chloroflexi bacterium]|nr:hypothetical protein [Chloroflexota bacterium]
MMCPSDFCANAFQPLDPMQVVLPAIFALGGFFAGGAGWGILMGRLAPAANRRRMAIAGALGFAPITLAAGLMLQAIEPIALEQFGAIIPLHRLFTLLFVPTAFLIAGVSAWAIGMGLNDNALAQTLGWRVGLAAAITFLMINLTMESAGWVVGAPRAEERFTMLTVMFVGDLGAAIVGGAVMGRMLAKRWSDTAHPESSADIRQRAEG